MIYGDKLREALKTEKNPVNTMYLNELMFGWRNVESILDEENESREDIIVSLVNAISTYTEDLTANKKFHYTEKSKTGFSPEHEVFKPHYIIDIIELIFKINKITDSTKGLSLKKRYFHTGFTLKKDSFQNTLKKPYLKYVVSDSYYSLCLELDLQYRLTAKKFFNKIKVYIPLIVFYVKNSFNNYDIENIKKLKQDITGLNPNALVFYLTEYIDKAFIEQMEVIKEDIYVLRKAIKGSFSPLDANLFKDIQDRITHYLTEENLSIEEIISLGNINFKNNTSEET